MLSFQAFYLFQYVIQSFVILLGLIYAPEDGNAQRECGNGDNV